QPFLRRRLDRGARRAEASAAAAVAGVLQLHDEAVRIVEKNLGAIAACGDLDLHRAAIVAPGDAVLGERLEDLISVEAVHAEAVALDRRRRVGIVRKREVLRS